MDNRKICVELWKRYKAGEIDLKTLQTELLRLDGYVYEPPPKEVKAITDTFGGTA